MTETNFRSVSLYPENKLYGTREQRGIRLAESLLTGRGLVFERHQQSALSTEPPKSDGHRAASEGAVINSWQRCADVIRHRYGFALSMASGLEDTATGRYWLDNAARWQLLYRLVRRHRRTLWPAECDVD